jgi:hypothetical protein
VPVCKVSRAGLVYAAARLGYSETNRRPGVVPVMLRLLAPFLIAAFASVSVYAQDSAITPEGPQAPGDTMQAPEGQTVADVNAKIEELLGDPGQFQAAFNAVTAAIGESNPAELARWVAYPMTISYNDEELIIEDDNDFVNNYEDLVTEDVYEAVRNQRYADLFVSSDGVMFGDGQIWMSFVCRDEACTQSDVKIISIHSTLR